MDLAEAVPLEASRVVGTDVEVDEQPDASARERCEGSFRAGVGATQHAGRDPPSPVGQPEEHAEGNPRPCQAVSSACGGPLLSGMRPILHPRTVPPGRLGYNLGTGTPAAPICAESPAALPTTLVGL